MADEYGSNGAQQNGRFVNDADHAMMIGDVERLESLDRAVLVVITKDEDGTPRYIVTDYGCDDWFETLGVLQCGISYVQSGMWPSEAEGQPEPPSEGAHSDAEGIA